LTQPLSHGGGAPSLASGEERRRSQRVVIRVPVTLHCVVAGKNVKVHASTVSVNDQGAMLLSSQSLPANATFELQNDRTHEKQQCRVVRAPVDTAEGHMIPVEFTGAAPDFWRITFPPTNWKPLDD
jgi:hypothetical protein